MREHKFRAWDKKLGGWLDLHSLLIDCNGRVIGYADDAGNNFRTLDCIELVEYTGLQDKNGKEIYEGDIIRHQLNNAGIEKNKTFAISSVIFVRGAFTVDYNPKILIWGLGYNCTEDGQLGHVEVIGNIWENKELLND